VTKFPVNFPVSREITAETGSRSTETSARKGRSIPDTWVTVYSGDMGNTFGPKGFSIGSSLHVSRSKYARS
jgi:hypothetical protein